MTMVADTPAPAELMAAARALSVFDAGLIVKDEPPTVKVRLFELVMDWLLGSETTGSPPVLRVVVGLPGVVTSIE